jgi:hypothetical protein
VTGSALETGPSGRRRLRALLLALIAVFAFLLAPVHAARADGAADPIEKSPSDVPLVVQPQAIVIPPVPQTDLVADLGWLHVAYPPAARERVQPLLDDADDIKAKLADELGEPVLTRLVDVRIAKTPEDMVDLAPEEVPPPRYASAVAMPGLRLVILSMRAPLSDEGTDLGELLRHELAHIALTDAVESKHVPFWFNEGYAMHASNERASERMKTLSEASLFRTIIPLSELDRTSPTEHPQVDIAYAESADFVRFLLRRTDRARFGAMIERTRKGQAFDRALGDAYGSDVRKLEYEWREELAKTYTFWPVLLGGSSIWVIAFGALAVGWVRRKRRNKVTLERWEREERAEDEELARRAAIRAAITTEPPPGPDPAHRASVPKIEHDGDWHTLH